MPAPADLGFLLHKHPDRAQSFDLASGKVHVVWPEVTDERSTVAVLLEVDPVALVRGRSGRGDTGFSLSQYVNDRPYAASSMLSVALGKVFRTAMSGRCDARPELAGSAIPLEVHVPVLPTRGGVDLVERLFAPLGWSVTTTAIALDEQVPSWGASPYVDLRLAGVLTVADALTQLYVLMPVLDDTKHYWVSTDEVDKLMRAGGGWLADHPERELITSRYLGHHRTLVQDAVGRLAELDDTEAEVGDDGPDEGVEERPTSMGQLRKAAVVAALRSEGAATVVDLGCGEGALLRELVADPAFTRVIGGRRVAPGAGDRDPAAAPGPDARLPTRPAGAPAVLGDLPRRPAGGPRRGGLDGGRRARRPATAAGAGAERLRPRPSDVGASHHPERRAQRALPEPRGRRDAAPRPPFRVDPARVPGVGGRDGDGVRLHRPVRARGRGRPRGGSPDPAGRVPEGDRMTELAVPELSLVCLVGASGSGKSTFARQHFAPFEVLSSDFFRGLVSNDENDQSATAAAFDALHHVAGLRLDGGHLTVVDATNVQPEARRQLVALARAHDVLPVAVVLDLPERVCLDRNATRPERNYPDSVVKRQRDQLRRSLRQLGKEGFRKVHVLRSEQEVAEAVVVRERLLNDFRGEQGPFDVVGDVHGCRAELESLLTELGYTLVPDEQGRPVDAQPPGQRKAVFVGDLVDRGPDTPGVLRLVMGMVTAGHALCVPGNHESKLVRALQGRDVQVSHGLETTLAPAGRRDT